MYSIFKKPKKLFKGKKGQITEVVIFMFIVLILACTVILARYVLNNFYDGMEEIDDLPQVVKDAKASTMIGFNIFDYAMALFIVILIIGLLISSYLIPTHPVYLVINIFGIIFLIFMGMIMTNIYGEFVSGDGTADTLGVVADGYPTINFIMCYLPYIGAIAIALASIVMFAKGS